MLFNDYVSPFLLSFFLFKTQKNVKTIIFSELPQADKIKYFNFLLENDINFSRDESGNYVALVKVLNPAFYGGNQNQNNNAQYSKPEAKKNSNTNSITSSIDNKNKEDPKLKTGPRGGGARSMPKNIANQKNYMQKNNLNSYGNDPNDNNSHKKKNFHKSNEHFEKEKKPVSEYFNIFYNN